jgi:hypothetical protein
MHGIFPVYSSSNEYHYHSPLRNDNTPSFHVNVIKNKWHDKGTGLGGDSIDLVAKHQNKTRSQACHLLSKSGLYSGDYVPEFPKIQNSRGYLSHHATTKKPTNSKYATLEAGNSFIIDNIGELQHPILLQYLKYRRINPQIAKNHGLQEINYQILNIPDSHYFALAWFNDSGGCEFNSKSGEKSFKGCLGSKDITTINIQKHKKLAVFESATDFWAYLSYYEISEFQNSAIILNSLSLRHKIFAIIAEYQPTAVYLFLDNDVEGRKVAKSLIADMKDIAVYDKSDLYKNHKDFNEMVMHAIDNKR